MPREKLSLRHGEMTRWHWTVWHPGNLTISDSCDIGAFTYINALHGIAIGENVQVGSHCAIYSVSTIDGKAGPVTIGDGARIGTHSTIMPGVTIGRNALVAAYSFVNQDVPENARVGGVPARSLASRERDDR